MAKPTAPPPFPDGPSPPASTVYHVTATISGPDSTKTIEGEFSVSEVPPVIEDEPPVITVQPEGVTIQPGETATLVCEATGTEPLAFEWWDEAGPLVGMTTGVLEVKPDTTHDYYCVVSNAAGDTESNSATVTVEEKDEEFPPTITKQPVGMTVVSGQVVTLTIEATGSIPLTYQWRQAGLPIEGATAPSYVTPPLMAETTFDCEVTNDYGVAISAPAEFVVIVPVPTEGLGLSFVRTIGLPPLYMGYAYGDMTGRIVNGKPRLLFSGDWVGQGSPIYEVEIGTGPVATFVKDWQNPYHGRRGTYITVDGVEDTIAALSNPSVRLRHPPGVRGDGLRKAVLANWRRQRAKMDVDGTAQSGEPVYYSFDDASTPALNGGHYYHAGQGLLHVTYADSYNVSGRPDWNVVTIRLHDDGTSECWGPWRVVITDGDGGIRYGPRAGMFLREHPLNAEEILTATGLGSGNVGFPWGANLNGSARWPSNTTPEAADLVMAERYLYHYHMIGKISSGVATGPLRSQRRPVHPAIGEWRNDGNMELFVDPALNDGVGSWTENDSLGGFFPLPDRTYFFAGVAGSPIQDPANPKAAHVFYANGGNEFKCKHHVDAVPAGITGPTSTARFPSAWHYPTSVLEAVRSGNAQDWAQEPTAFANLELEHGIVTAPIDSVGNAKMIASGFFDAERRKLYLMAQGADRGTITWGLINAFIHEYDVA